MAFNVSNRYLTLEPVLGSLARDAGIACVAQEDQRRHNDDSPDTDASDWVVMARSERELRAVAPTAGGWQDCGLSSATSVWTDDFSNLLTAIDLDG